ncbi:methylaspartate ammonia-lyase [Halovivax gelatinilyticus]|uniref:methylaspartate ammonia-lyase n=1 Tax=Halovivax gelatinilyticus TaxID=2961597 RepID=UPI0020CA31B8|nr:methylaspartate ammonia-lyase [Halovivax gelatinilyticus]
MIVESITATPGVSGFFVDDQRAITAGAQRDGFAYRGEPVTPGFDRIRQPGTSLVVTIECSDGTSLRGDCVTVQYSGAGGRDPVFDPTAQRSTVEDELGPRLLGRDLEAFASNVELVESVSVDDRQLHSAVRYGVSQALCAGAARARRTTMTDVLAAHVGSDPATVPIPVFGQSGANRYTNAEKMILAGVPVLPHGLFNARTVFGNRGEGLRTYLEWLADRIDDLGADDYEPTIHVDIYGLLGSCFGSPYDRSSVVKFVASLEAAARPYDLQLEGPMDAGGRAEQIRAMAELGDGLASAGVDVDLVADEWCNTEADVRAFVDAGAADLVQVKTPDLGGVHRSASAVRYCDGTETRAYLGGTCNETETSARVSAHVALATEPAQILAKPGMGVTAGYAVVENEMRRTIARRETRRLEAVSDD